MGKTAARIAEIALQNGARTIVVGYPINMDGSAGPRAERTDNFINTLRVALCGGDGGDSGGDAPGSGSGSGSGSGAINIIKWDERLSSVEAARILKATDAKPAPGRASPRRAAPRRAASHKPQEKGRLDVMAAAIILQSYLDSKINNGGSRPEGDPNERR